MKIHIHLTLGERTPFRISTARWITTPLKSSKPFARYSHRDRIKARYSEIEQELLNEFINQIQMQKSRSKDVVPVCSSGWKIINAVFPNSQKVTAGRPRGEKEDGLKMKSSNDQFIIIKSFNPSKSIRIMSRPNDSNEIAQEFSTLKRLGRLISKFRGNDPDLDVPQEIPASECDATFALSADSWLLHQTQTHSPGPLFQPLSLSTRGRVLRPSIIHRHTTSLLMLSYIIHAFMLMLIWEIHHSLASLQFSWLVLGLLVHYWWWWSLAKHPVSSSN